MKNYLLFFCFLIKLPVYSQSGTLDLSFGMGGKVTTAFGSTYARGNSIAIQNDGKIVVAGASNNGVNDDFALARYNSDGTLDNTFGSVGKVLTDFGSGSDRAYSVSIQIDGKIVVAGNTYTNNYVYDFAVVRYNSNGSLDSTFGSSGKVLTDFGNTNDFGYSVLVQNDGKIVVAGSSYNHIQWSFALVRYNINGSLDNSFGIGGKVTSDFGHFDEVGSALIQSDGKIVVAGWRYDNGSWRNFALVRFNINGSLDGTFGSGGTVVTDFGGDSDTGNSVSMQSDGKIVVAGWSINSGLGFALARYENNGILDNTFGSGGKVITAIGGSSQGNSVVIQSDGKIVVAGDNNNGVNRDFVLVRYNIDGSLDNSFGSSGVAITDFGGDDWGNSVTIQNDGKIIVAGYTDTGSNWYIAIARYDNSLATSLNEITEPLSVSFFPNPSFGIFTVNLKNKTVETKICVYDVFGNCVYEKVSMKNSTKEIDLSSQAKGIYLMEIMSEGEKAVKKIVLE